MVRLLVLWDVEHCVAKRSLIALAKKIVHCWNDYHARLDGLDVVKECYLVDPASSHMLVSKIKPCMCKYELIQTVKLRMAH